jgi:hypothetical protein
MPESKVYILGAGCSKHCGYPLGAEVKADLENFSRSLDSSNSPRLKKAVAETVALLDTTTETVERVRVRLGCWAALSSSRKISDSMNPCPSSSGCRRIIDSVKKTHYDFFCSRFISTAPIDHRRDRRLRGQSWVQPSRPEPATSAPDMIEKS